MFKKILEVFTKEYRKETEYYNFLQSRISDFKLKGTDEDIEEKIKVLQNLSYYRH